MTTKRLGPQAPTSSASSRTRVAQQRRSERAGEAKGVKAADALHDVEAASDGGASTFEKGHERGRPTELDAHALAKHVATQAWFDAGKPIASVEVLAEQQLHVPPDPVGASSGGSSASSAVKHSLVGVNVRFDDGTKERYLVPLRIDAKGNVSDALASPAFKRAMLDGVARGVSFTLQETATTLTPERARRKSAEPRTHSGPSHAAAAATKGWLGATMTKASVDKRGVIEGGAYDAKLEAASLARAVYGETSAKNPWRALVDKGYTTRERYEHVVEQARKLSPANADALVVEFFKNVARTLDKQPESVKAFHEAVATQPKFGPVFYGYVQFIGTPDAKTDATFDDLVGALDVIQNPLASMTRGKGTVAGFGFRELELLPFFSSPQKDGGYDISNHAQVATEMGGDEAHARFMSEAVKRGVRVTADLVANHVSNEHDWVKALLKGDESMLSRFVVWDDAVKLGERVVDDKTFNVFLHTKGKDAGKVSHVWQIFPDNNPDTMIEAKAGEGPDAKKHNIFASFMNPYQWDVNAADPHVLSHYLEAIGHFTNLGQMGTRMDAIIHMGKSPGTFNMNNPESQAFMALTKAFASHVAPGNMFLPEANLPWETAKKDWLDPQATFAGKVENLAGDALISFDVHRAIWDSLLKGTKDAWLDVQRGLGELPSNKSLLVYLGLHDETLIDDPELRKALVAKGAHDFAGRGVGDSPAALLDGDADRLAMAHVLLYSSKGHPAVYYRTLVGAPNNTEYFDAKTQQRLEAQKLAGEQPNVAKSKDTRDLDRGPVSKADYERALRDGYKPAVTIRALNALWDKNGSVRTNRIDEVKTSESAVVSFARTSTTDPALLQLVNLSGAQKRVTFEATDLARQLGWADLSKGSLTDLLASEIAGAERTVNVRVVGSKVTIDLAPYQAVYLQHG